MKIRKYVLNVRIFVCFTYTVQSHFIFLFRLYLNIICQAAWVPQRFVKCFWCFPETKLENTDLGYCLHNNFCQMIYLNIWLKLFVINFCLGGIGKNFLRSSETSFIIFFKYIIFFKSGDSRKIGEGLHPNRAQRNHF